MAGSSSSWLALGGVSPGILNLLPGLVFLVGGGVFLTVVRVLLDGMAGVWGVVGLLSAGAAPWLAG